MTTPPPSLHLLCARAAKWFEEAATATDPVSAATHATSNEASAAFKTALKATEFVRDVLLYWGPVPQGDILTRATCAMLSAYRVRCSWRAEVAQWEMRHTPAANRVQAKPPISGFVRGFILKTVTRLARAGVFTEEKGEPLLDDDDADEAFAVGGTEPVLSPAKIERAEHELRVLLACTPCDVLSAAFRFAAGFERLPRRMARYSPFLEETFFSRGEVDQSNVLCVLAVRGRLPDVMLQLIGTMACNPRGKPLPVRAPRLSTTDAIVAQLQCLIRNVVAGQATVSQTRSCLKRVLDAIPPPAGSLAALPPVMPPKKKARRAAPRKKRAAPAAAAVVAAFPGAHFLPAAAGAMSDDEADEPILVESSEDEDA